VPQHREHERKAVTHWLGRWMSPALRSMRAISRLSCASQASRAADSTPATATTMTVTSVRRAAAVCNVTPPVIRRWRSLGLIPAPPWTLQQLHQVRDEADPQHRPGPGVAHGTLTRWLEGCDCNPCRLATNAATKARGSSPRDPKRKSPGLEPGLSRCLSGLARRRVDQEATVAVAGVTGLEA
jgi:hypothetical protein